jgi:hypothetical protein
MALIRDQYVTFRSGRKRILIRTEIWDKHVTIAICKTREDLDPVKILYQIGTLQAKSAHMSRIGSSQPPPSIPEWLSLVVRDEI